MSLKLLNHRAALCNQVCRIASDAGALTLEYFEGVKEMEATSKGDGSPVTVADQEAERFITENLQSILPDIPVIGEESFCAGQGADFSKHDYFWLVDPIDGTRAFVRGDEEFTVNIGLIHKKEPVLGAIYAPAKGELYAGFINDDGSGRSFRYFEDSENEKDMRTRQMPQKGLTIMAGLGRAAAQLERRDQLLDAFKVAKIVRQSSSLKICAVASGKADLYPRFGKTCEWDTAAGHAILRAAGGDIVKLDGQSLLYGGTCPDLLNPEFIAMSGDLMQVGIFE